MSYAPPSGDASNFTWVGSGAYSPPAGNAADLTWQPVITTRTLRSGVSSPWGKAVAASSSVAAPFAPTAEARTDVIGRWGPRNAQIVPPSARAAWGVAASRDRDFDVVWDRYLRALEASTTGEWGASESADSDFGLPWGKYKRRPRMSSRHPWVPPRFADRMGALPWGRFDARLFGQFVAVLPGAGPRNPGWILPWLRYSRPLNPGWGVVVEPNNPPTDEHGTLIVPIRRAYIVLNDITLILASDSTPLTATAISVQIDADSWTWGWDATIPGDELELVEPTAPDAPVELIATINGEQFRLLVERIARDRRFGQSRLRISGRSRAAMLASPYSPIVTRSNAGAMTMQQLADDALTTNGVPLGWLVDWQAANWLVPAGAWNNTGSYIEHVQRLAEAAGAYVQPDPLLDTLHVLPRYPLLPWEWGAATPDIILPSAPVVREAIEWVDKARYNRVFISGSAAGGVLGQVTRAGTAGDVVAPMITDALTTHADAARARGRAVLADTGRQARITLDLPILEETGIIAPGKLVRYTDGGAERVGLVRSTAVRAQMPTARQTIELETHA